MVNVYNEAGRSIVLPFGLNPSTIAAGAMHNKLISGFDSGMFKTANVTTAEVNRHPRSKDFLFTDLCKYLGFMVPIQAGNDGKYGHWENDWSRQTLVVGEDGFDGAGGAGVEVTFDLDPDTLYHDTTLNRYLSYARLNQIVHLQFDSIDTVNCMIVDITPNGTTQTITMKPDDSTLNLLGMLGGVGAGAGMELSITTNAHAEGSKQGKSLQHRNIRYENQLQIVKEDDAKTGSFLTRGFYIEKVTVDDGRTVMYELKGAEEAELRLRYAIDGACLVGTRNDNFTEENSSQIREEWEGMPISTTQGLIPFIQQNGNLLPYTVGDVGIGDFDALNDLLDAEGAPLDYIIPYGSQWGQEIREALKEYLGDTVPNGYVESSMFGGGEGGKALAISVGFSSVRIMGSQRTFNLKQVDSFNDPKGLGTASHTYKQMYMALPMKSFKNTDKAANRSSLFGSEFNSESMPCWGYCYSAKNGYNREMEMWRTGAAGGEGRMIDRYTNDEDVLEAHFRGEFGSWNACPNLMVIGYPENESS